MSQWINWLFGPEKPAPSSVKPEGEIRCDNDKAFYVARKGYRETVIDLTQLQYVYVYTTDDCQNLVLNDYHQQFIPVSVAGFKTFFQYLSSRLLLDKAKFYEVLASKKAQKVELWRVNSPDNCIILDSSHDLALTGQELCEGFKQTPQKVAEQLFVSSANFIIWLDETNGKVGFANLEKAMIFPLETLESFQCENVVPDRSSGGVYLSAILKQGDRNIILIGDCYSFDSHVGQLAELIRLPVSELTAYE